jgi:hypothetical protein
MPLAKASSRYSRLESREYPLPSRLLLGAVRKAIGASESTSYLTRFVDAAAKAITSDIIRRCRVDWAVRRRAEGALSTGTEIGGADYLA